MAGGKVACSVASFWRFTVARFGLNSPGFLAPLRKSGAGGRRPRDLRRAAAATPEATVQTPLSVH